MNDLELRLTAAMREAVDGHHAPADLADRVRRRHRRRSALTATLAVAATAAALALVVAVLGPHRPATAPAGGSTRHLRTSKRVRANHGGNAQPVARLRGLPMGAGAHVRLLLTGRSTEWFQAATGSLQRIGGLPADDGGYAFTRLAGGWAAQPEQQGPHCQDDCAGPPAPAYFVASGAASAAPIASGYAVAAGEKRGEVWLVTYRRRSSSMSNAQATVQEVTLSGQPLGQPAVLPAGYQPVRAVGRYLLLGPVNEGPPAVLFKLWDPRTGRVIRTLPDVIAASADQIAYGRTCGGCLVHMLDARSGRQISVRMPAMTWGFDGTFSPDNRFLALQLSTSHVNGGAAFRADVAVIDTATGQLMVLDGTAESPNARDQWTFGWQAGADQLVIALPQRGTRFQLATWRPGQSQLRVATISLPRGTYPVLGERG
jgi:hypothetical protein